MSYRLRELNLPILPKGSPSLRVLHFSDLHLTPNRKREISIIRSWAELKPDLVISTGDFLGHKSAIDTALFALDPLLFSPGLYVFGSNDYYGPRIKNPLSYLKEDDGTRKLGPPLDTDHFDRKLKERGWKNLNTSRVELFIKGVSIEARGTDDAHLSLDDYSLVAGKKNPKVDISIGVTHAPYKRVLDSMADDGLDIIFAGHTHGGQIRMPWFKGTRSLVTNCDLPNSQSRGLSPLEKNSLLHVSAGLGESAFAPYRFFCPREATILALKPKS